MSEKTKILLYALWFAQPVLEAVIALAMFRRGQHRVFKYFFAYVVAQVVTFAVLFPAYLGNSSGYFYISSFSTAVSVALGFKVIHEAFLDIFRPFHTLRDLGTVLFKWAGLVMLLVAGVVSISSNSTDIAPWIQAILTAQRCVRIIQVGMVLFLLFFARYLGVSRRQHSFGISLGFGVFAMVELGLIASLVGYYHLGEIAISFINVVAYNCTLLIWLWYTFAKSPAREEGSTLLRPQRWEQGLSVIHHPLPADSLIPMFEGMVDRALSRNQDLPTVRREGNAAAAAVGMAPTSATISALPARAGSQK